MPPPRRPAWLSQFQPLLRLPGSRRRASAAAAAFLLGVFCCSLPAPSFGSGYYGPTNFLSPGGSNLAATPEFDWDLEVKRLARDFHPSEKLHLTPLQFSGGDECKTDQSPLFEASARADQEDFAAALKEHRLNPPDPQAATNQHGKARESIGTPAHLPDESLPAEFDSEFADYHRGAYAYLRGHYDEARQAWQALLARPASQRHYRSVWAAFMLGKMALKTAQPDAPAWFQKTRALAHDGFADSLGMAADSYGWEGRSEWKQNHPAKAAPLFLTQLALGDQSAIVSLKALIPDRTSVDGMLNYGDEDPNPNASPTPAAESGQKVPDAALPALQAAAADPLLRRLVTVHILATESGGSTFFGDDRSTERSRGPRWLAVLKKAKITALPDAEYLGWVAYNVGDYPQARRWLALASPARPAAQWLQAKLELREGHIPAAATLMQQAWPALHDPDAYTGWHAALTGSAAEMESSFIYRGDYDGWSTNSWASGDLGELRLLHSDFVQAFDTFFRAGMWTEAAFVAERVLTTAELKTYVDQLPSTPPSVQPGSLPFSPYEDQDPAARLRYLLARRLVREDQYTAAAPLLPAPFRVVLEHYVTALRDGANTSLPKPRRAQAFSTAAWLARHSGMEMMGTEVAPDGFENEGLFPEPDLATEQLTGKYTPTSFNDGDSKPLPIPFPPPKGEIVRLKQNAIHPDIRFHYRAIATALAMKAAALMPDNTELLADLLNTAGKWVDVRDAKAADRCYQAIEKRCSKTKIGKEAIARRWFSDQTGPWVAEQQAAYTALNQQLGGALTSGRN